MRMERDVAEEGAFQNRLCCPVVVGLVILFASFVFGGGGPRPPHPTRDRNKINNKVDFDRLMLTFVWYLYVVMK
jgi:hypothetical protein